MLLLSCVFPLRSPLLICVNLFLMNAFCTVNNKYIETHKYRTLFNLFHCALRPRLLHDRELDLYDGTRLLRWDRYQTLKEQLQFSDEQLKERYTHTHRGVCWEVCVCAPPRTLKNPPKLAGRMYVVGRLC